MVITRQPEGERTLTCHPWKHRFLIVSSRGEACGTVNEQPLDSPGTLCKRLFELASLFLKLGTIGFGGPAAHIALIESEIVHKRQWVTKQQFLDMLGAANLIPGPTSTEMAINTGWVRAGWAGLCVAGASFIVPAALITGAFAWAYVHYGSLRQTAAVLAGIKPAVIALILIAIWRLGKTAVKGPGLALLGAAALAVFFLQVNPIVILLGGGTVGMLAGRASTLRTGSASLFAPLLRVGWLSRRGMFGATILASGVVAEHASLAQIALFFLRIGAVLYGGGYVLLAFLDHGLVQQNAWLRQQQLLDAIAIGQFTPGPLFSTATFVGYLLAGVPGAAVATVCIFLPSFFYVALLAPVLFRLRESVWMAAFLDSVNVCALALMAGVTFRLAVDAMRGWPSWVIGAAALAVLLRWKLNPAWIILAGGVAGLLFATFR